MEVQTESDSTPSTTGVDTTRQAQTTDNPVAVVFVLRSLRPLRYYQSALELLVARGHRLCLLLERQEHGPAEQEWLDEMLVHENFTTRLIRIKKTNWQRRARALRRAMEYVHFLGPEFQDKRRYTMKALRRSPPPGIKQIAALPLIRRPAGLRLLYRTLAALELLMPSQKEPAQELRTLRPDVVIFGDSGNRASLYVDILRAARQAGIPTATWIASWDNLTTRPRLSESPRRLFVWNELQRAEAERIHEMPADRVDVTGAPNFDHWFAWRPRPAAEFFELVGLDPGRPMLLWVGSAINNWETPELPFVQRWLEGLRSADSDLLRSASVIVRPHPLRLDQWEDADLSRFENVRIWPDALSMPVATEQKAAYYDSIFHSRAVIGINTSAMVEASIIGRPVFTILDPDYYDSQHGALHFSYLLESGGGVLRAAPSLDAHYAELAETLEQDASAADAAAKDFVLNFVRPRGLDQPATPILVDAVERLAAEGLAPVPDPLWIRILRPPLVVVGSIPAVLRRQLARIRHHGARLMKNARRTARRVRRAASRVVRAR